MVRRPQPYVFESFGVRFANGDTDGPGDYDRYLLTPGAIGLCADILALLGERATYKSRLLTQKDDYWFTHLYNSYQDWIRRGSPDEQPGTDIPREGLQEPMRSMRGPKHWDTTRRCLQMAPISIPLHIQLPSHLCIAKRSMMASPRPRGVDQDGLTILPSKAITLHRHPHRQQYHRSSQAKSQAFERTWQPRVGAWTPLTGE